jgi:hypothetical protein
MGKCDLKYRKAWEVGLKKACKELARVYYAVVSGSYGAKYFNKYTAERCICSPQFCT